jgi:adenine-specific DNA-methyltransferase
MKKHKTLGQVFTPQWIVNEILDLVGYNDEKILNKYILEPASGEGVFLLEIVNRYLTVAFKANLSAQEIAQNLEKYIYAVELDEIAHQKSITQLNQLISLKLGKDIQIQWNIYQKNTLDFYKDYPDFFDFVVGNPPYIRIHNLDAETREILKNEFIFSEGTIDIYLSFFEMGLKMMKKEAHLGYITPNSYLHNSSYKYFREYLKEQRIVKTLIDFKANKIFKGFSTYTAITVIQKNYSKDFFEYKELLNQKIESVNQVQFKELDHKDWSFSNQKDAQFMLNLGKDRDASIKDFFDVQYGFATLRDKIYIAKAENHNESLMNFDGHLIEKELLKKIIKGSKYKGAMDEKTFVLFPYKLIKERYEVIPESILKEEYPCAYQYFFQHKEELLKRDIDKGATWYEFGRSQGIQSMHHEKIVLSTLMNDKIHFYKVPAEVMVYSGLYIIKNKPESSWSMIEKTLSSEEFLRYIRITGKDFSGGYKSITSKQIKEFRIKK